MTDFQTSLIAAAGVFVAGVFIYNKWQEHKAKKSVERAFASEHDDVLMRTEEPAFDAAGLEPSLDPAHAPVHVHADVPVQAPVHAPAGARAEPSFTLGDVPMVDAGSGAYGKPPHEDPVAPSVVADDVQRVEPSAGVPEDAVQPAASVAPAASAAPIGAAPAAAAAPASAPTPAPASAPTLAPAPAPAPLAEPVMPAAVAPSELATAALVDPLIDCLLPLDMAAPMRGEKLLPALHKLRLVGNKPVHFVGLAVSGDWEAIRHGVVYTKLQGGVQLASRTTALNELEYS